MGQPQDGHFCMRRALTVRQIDCARNRGGLLRSGGIRLRRHRDLSDLLRRCG